MPRQMDILDEPEPLKKSFAGAVLFHLSLVASIAAVSIARHGDGMMLGTEHGKAGSVPVVVVGTIPLPRSNAPANPVANDTPSQLPTPKEPAKSQPRKPKPEVKPPDPRALAIAGGYTKKSYTPPDKFREKQQDRKNQLTSTAGQQLSSPMMAIEGSGKMGLGENAPFGNQFGAYAAELRRLVANKWTTAEVDARVRTAPTVTVTFTLRRDGSISKPEVTRSSGNGALDRSGVRAILDAAPFPKMPPTFPKDQTVIDFVFELKR